MTLADETRAELDRLWSAIFALYRSKPAVGTLGAEAVGLALEAEELVAGEPARARASIRRADELLQDLGKPAA